MRQKNYSRTILTFFLIMMLTLAIPMQHAGASSIIKPETFQTGTVGNDFISTSASFYTTATVRNYKIVDIGRSGVPLKGWGSKEGGNDAQGYWTITSSNHITKFSGWYMHTVSASVSGFGIYFYNSTIMGASDPLTTLAKCILGKKISDTRNGRILTAGGVWTNTATSNDAQIQYFEVDILNELGDVTYRHRTAAGVWTNATVTASNASQITAGYRIDRILFQNAATTNAYWDDINITYAAAYSGQPPQVGCIDTTGLTQVGYFGSTQRDSPAQYISKTYGVSVTTTIEGVELQVSRDQILQAGDMGNYELKINGMSLGMPTCSVLLEAYGILQWVTNMVITNNVVNFEFYHSKKTLGWYWQVGVGATSSTDLDGDGDIWYRQSRAETTYEWRWFWIFPYQAPIYDVHAEEIPYDMAVKWWSTGFAPPSGIGYDYNDDIGLSKYVYYNNATETYIYNLSRKNHDTIFGGYTLNDPVATYCVHLYTISCDFNTSNASEIRTIHWPHACNYPGSTFGYAPLTSACYIVRLHKDGGVEKQLNISVEGTIGDYSIRTSPSITNQYETYEVLWRYYQAQGHTGRIGMMSIHKDALKVYANTEVTIPPISSNTTGTYTHYSTSSTAEYWGLYVYANNQYVLYAETTHIIRVPSIYENTIRPLLETVELYGSNQLLGQHIFPGADVRVYVNDRLIQNVGDSQSFTVTYETTQPGVHVAQLRIYLDSGTQVLAQCTFLVKTDVRPPTADTKDWDWLKLIPTEYVPLIGIALICGMALLPLIALTSLQKKVNIQIHVPDKVMIIISTVTGFTGYILTLYWGLFEWWTIFMILFSFILILAILYYSGHKDGGGGGGTQ